jgi:hypothetical protein
MTALILQVTPFVEIVTPRLRAVYMRFLHAFDAFAEARMRNAVPAWQLRRAQRELDRCRRLTRAKKRLPVKTGRTGR